MQNLVFTQLSVSEVRQMIKEEVKNVLLEYFPKEQMENTNVLLDINQVANLLGLAVPSVYGLTHQKKIPYIKKGKKLYFEKAEIMEWLHQGKQKTNAQIEEEADQYMANRRMNKPLY